MRRCLLPFGDPPAPDIGGRLERQYQRVLAGRDAGKRRLPHEMNGRLLRFLREGPERTRGTENLLVDRPHRGRAACEVVLDRDHGLITYDGSPIDRSSE